MLVLIIADGSYFRHGLGLSITFRQSVIHSFIHVNRQHERWSSFFSCTSIRRHRSPISAPFGPIWGPLPRSNLIKRQSFLLPSILPVLSGQMGGHAVRNVVSLRQQREQLQLLGLGLSPYPLQSRFRLQGGGEPHNNSFRSLHLHPRCRRLLT